MVALLNLTPYSCVLCGKLVVRNKHQKDMCCNEIGPCVQNMDIILVSIVNPIGRAYVIFKEKENFHFDLLYFLHIVMFPKLDKVISFFVICDCLPKEAILYLIERSKVSV